jgi:hypothetical protein
MHLQFTRIGQSASWDMDDMASRYESTHNTPTYKTRTTDHKNAHQDSV